MGQLEDMALFVRVVEAGNISKAAEQLNIAKSAVSRRLVELESRLGSQLLIRNTRNSRLTNQGEMFYQRALTILQDVEALNEEAKTEARADLTGEMRISVPNEFGMMHMPGILERFARQHPNLLIHVDFSNRHANLVEEGYEMALRIAFLKDSSLHARKLCEVHHVLAASPDYLQQYGIPKKPEDLLKHRFLSFSLSTFSATKMRDKTGYTHEIQPGAVMKTNNGFFLKEMAIRSMGIICLPTFIIYDALQEGKLQPLLEDYDFTPLDLTAVYPHSKFTNANVRALIDFLIADFGDTPYWDKTHC